MSNGDSTVNGSPIPVARTQSGMRVQQYDLLETTSNAPL